MEAAPFGKKNYCQPDPIGSDRLEPLIFQPSTIGGASSGMDWILWFPIQRYLRAQKYSTGFLMMMFSLHKPVFLHLFVKSYDANPQRSGSPGSNVVAPDKRLMNQGAFSDLAVIDQGIAACGVVNIAGLHLLAHKLW